MKQSKLLLALAAAFSLPFKATLAAAAVDSETADNAPQLDQIEVRASADKRSMRKSRAGSRLNLSVQDTPASISVITQVDLRKRGETTPLEALENAPGIAPGYAFGVLNISGRGFSGVQNSPSLFDGVRYPGFTVTPRLTLNYQQIEVLRGPAGLAAGRGSIGGAINYVPRRADGRVEGQARRRPGLCR